MLRGLAGQFSIVLVPAHRYYRDLLLAWLISTLGTWTAFFAVRIALYQQTNSPIWITALLFCELAPGVILGITVGPLIDRWTLELPAAQAVKNRRSLLAEAMREVAAGWPAAEPVRVTSLASGPAREFFDVLTAADPPNVIATCVDIDHEALAYASGIAQQLGLTDRFTFAQDNVVRLTQGRGHTALGPQALIYSVGLTDYLQDAFVVNLIDWAHELLQPGGTLIIGNVVPSNPTRAFMDHILEWVLIHRSEQELRELFGRSRFGSTPVTFRTEPAGVDLFAFCRKA